jgi:lantibiotic modifying enzyme
MATFTAGGNMDVKAEDIFDGTKVTTVTINSSMVAKDVVDKIHGINDELSAKVENMIQLMLEHKKEGDQKRVEQTIIDMGKIVDDSPLLSSLPFIANVLSHILIRI